MEDLLHRYSAPGVRELFQPNPQMSLWSEIEAAVIVALSETGVIPAVDARKILDRWPDIDKDFVESVNDRETVVNHDVAAFVDVLHEQVGISQARWIHYGLTSSDLVDTALFISITRALGLIGTECNKLLSVTVSKAQEYVDAVCVGRTHGQPAEITTFGAKLALWGLHLAAQRDRLTAVKEASRVGKIAGPIGNYSVISSVVESMVCEQLGVVPIQGTQIIDRMKIVDVVAECARLCTVIEQFALEVRHLARFEVGEVQEGGKTPDHKGSSAMPHKVNPIMAERLCGIAHLVRAQISVAFENVALWHERDISHSSVERIMVPECLVLTHFAVTQARSLIDHLYVDAEAMEQRVNDNMRVLRSHEVLSAMVTAGSPRDEAYRKIRLDIVNMDQVLPSWEKIPDYPIEHARVLVGNLIDLTKRQRS